MGLYQFLLLFLSVLFATSQVQDPAIYIVMERGDFIQSGYENVTTCHPKSWSNPSQYDADSNIFCWEHPFLLTSKESIEVDDRTADLKLTCNSSKPVIWTFRDKGPSWRWHVESGKQDETHTKSWAVYYTILQVRKFRGIGFDQEFSPICMPLAKCSFCVKTNSTNCRGQWDFGARVEVKKGRDTDSDRFYNFSAHYPDFVV